MTAEVLTEAHPERMCANHPDFPAIAVCSLCGRDICGTCHSTTLHGYAVCERCPVAEGMIPKTSWERAQGFEHAYAFLHTSVAILSNPRTFFGFISKYGSWIKPAILGLACSTFGAFLGLTYQLRFIGQTAEIVDQLAVEVGVSKANAILLLYLSVPWSAMLVFAVHIVMLHLSLKVAGDDGDWRAATRIVGYSSVAHLFMIVPPLFEFPVGHFFAIMWLFNLEVTGVREFFGLSFGKSILVVLPGFFFVAMFGA